MKNRKSIIALLLVAIIGIVGLTVAYFSNSTSITNEFETSEYGTDVTETFTSPTGWQPGDETKKKMFTFTHTVNGNTVNESRYIGNDPNNYVYFNCTNDEDTSTCEKWRIIGTFDVERTDPEDATKTITETRMKLVRGDILENRAFNSSYYNNDWTVALLMTYLNGDYYNGTVTKGLTESARNKIDEAKYYLGAISFDSTTKYGTTEKIYGEERGTTICGACNGNSEKLTWEGNVGLMYPSDMYMVYKGVDDTCYTNPYGCSGSAGKTNGWVYNTNTLNGRSRTYTWLLSSTAGDSFRVLLADDDGNLYDDNSNRRRGVRPVVYLKSNIKIADGTGEVGSPYVLSGN